MILLKKEIIKNKGNNMKNNFKIMLFAVILSLGLNEELTQIKKEFDDIETNENQKIFITTTKKIDYKVVSKFPTNDYNRFFDYEIISTDLLEIEAKKQNEKLKIFSIKDSLYSLAIMYDEKSIDINPVLVDLKETNKKSNDFIDIDTTAIINYPIIAGI